MKTNRLICLVACLVCLALVFSACGQTEPQGESFSMTTLEGLYVEQIAQRGTLLLTASGEQTASLVIDWPNGAAAVSHWEMNVRYDPESRELVYDDAVLIDKTFNEQGEENDLVVYTHGSGSFAREGDKLLWTDNEETGSGKSAFVYEMSLSDYRNNQWAYADEPQESGASETPDEPEATPEPEPEVTQAPADPNLPIITKSPTDETVPIGGNCSFVARYENAVWAVWHFVSPDGQTDLTYEEASGQFPTLEIINGMYSTMKLRNIPAELNGWRVYCRYTNRSGDSDTKTALITVTDAPAPTPTPQGPVVRDWTETDSLEAALGGSGLSFTPPLAEALPAGLSLQGYRYRSGSIEARYADAQGETALTVRKSSTLSGTDLSEDTNSYSRTWNLTIKGVTLRCLGDGATVNTGTFDAGAEHFSISFNPGKEGQGLTVDQVNSLINCIQ